MEKFRLLIYFTAISLINLGTLQAADLKNGFMGIPWQTKISELPDFVQVAEKYGVKYYGNPKKSYTLFGVDVPYVTYAFYAGKFFAAYADIPSIDIFEQLKQHITQKYGSPRTTLKFNEGQKIYNWKHADTKIKLKLYENEGKMKLGFYYAPLAAKVNRAQREAFPPPQKPTFPLDERRLREAMEVMGF
ncbi:MAG: hypothetical protein JSW26_24315 [Desulfobacterales bacterium]|nr:MAG: hypothetical protein JSW26_24315 [Desulfobacterales bacterium]